MSSHTFSPSTYNFEHWQISFHEAMAVVLRLQESVQKTVSRQMGTLGILAGVWKSNRDLKVLNTGLKQISELPSGTIGRERLKNQTSQLRRLLLSIERSYTIAVGHGLTNRKLTGAAFECLRFQGESIADYIDSVELSFDNNALRSVRDGREQIKNGDFVVMQRLF